jgi:chromosome segregation ATPase
MYESDTVSMLTTQIAILESQIAVRDERVKRLETDLGHSESVIRKLHNDIEKKNALLKRLHEEAAYDELAKKGITFPDHQEDAGSIG